MRGRLLIILSFVLMLALLVALNAASYVRVEEQADLEFAPDRSTSSARPTGTRALYEFLEGSGFRVARWRETPDELLQPEKGDRPATFVVIGPTRREFTEDEAKRLLQWVSGGGRLVLIDRAPPPELLPPVENLRVEVESGEAPPLDLRADDVEAVIHGSSPIKPAQPTVLTSAVEQISPSRFAGRLRVRPLSAEEQKAEEEKQQKQINQGGIVVADDESFETELPPPPPPVAASPQPGEDASPSPVVVESVEDAPAGEGESVPAAESSPASSGGGIGPGEGQPGETENADDQSEVSEDESATPDEAGGEEEVEDEEAAPALAPVVHFSDKRGGLLADYRYGAGRIFVLSDPFVVANNGINRDDNLQLIVNLLTDGANGLIAFDEYHQGRGATHNQLISYFAGTPVLAACGQVALLALAVVWSRGRRFGRPVPAPRVDRRSKLEFVNSMAELQGRARAYDLAIENVYGRTRRALARYGGTDNSVPRQAIAERVAARSGLDKEEIERLMRACEDAINGQPLAARTALDLVARLRELERALGIRMRAREIRQAEKL